jgi:hypothetical protein
MPPARGRGKPLKTKDNSQQGHAVGRRAPDLQALFVTRV